MDPRARIVIIVVALSVVSGVVWLTGRSDGTVTASPTSFPSGTANPSAPSGCIKDRPPKRSTPAWLPRSMPLPPGTYVHDVPDKTAQGVHTAQLFVPVSLDDFVKLVLGTWKSKGWIPGVGEREPAEAEDTFSGPNGLYGQFRVSSFYCDAGTTNLYIALASRNDNATKSP